MRALAITHFPGIAERLPAAPHRPSLLQRIATWHRVARQRRQLRELDPRLLADMGLTAEDAAREASRPFWDVDVNAYH